LLIAEEVKLKYSLRYYYRLSVSCGRVEVLY